MKYRIYIPLLTLVLVALTCFPVHAAGLLQAGEPADPTGDLFTAFKNLTGVAVFISALINALKTMGVIKNGDAPAWSVGFNLAGMALLFGLQLAGRADLVPVLDTQASGLSQLLTVLISFVYQIFVTRLTHENALSGLPVIGKSFTGRAAGSGTLTELSGVLEVKQP